MGGTGKTRRHSVLRPVFGPPLIWLVPLLIMLTGGACSEPQDHDSQPASHQAASQAGAATDPGAEEGEWAPDGWTPDSPIRVDQFGYLPDDPKWAVLVDPEVGFNDHLDYEPGGPIAVRRSSDDAVVLTVVATAWEEGRVHEQSGDRGWWVDFSEVREPGSYYLVDVIAQVESPRFEIADDVYDSVLEAALRVFWYNRGNIAHPEELAGPWSDDAAFIGPDQDTEARWVDDRSNPDTALDLSGGWFDAGDTNKYVTFASEPVHQLLSAYRQAPQVFHDDLGIPESGNGIPDLIDEVRWEIEWLERMQQADGGVLIKVGVVDLEGPITPSRSDLPRYYEEACSSSTITAAGMFAHAASVFAAFPELSGDAERLTGRAEAAWQWYQQNPKRDDCDPQIIWAGDADLSINEQQVEEVVAAVHLLALTGDPAYNDAVTRGFELTQPFAAYGFGHYGPDQADALLIYRELAEASETVVKAIDARLAILVDSSPMLGFDPAADLYRSFMPDSSYHWGSNMVKANAGTANMIAGVGAAGRERALDHLHYFHGVNPLGTSYLSNMGDHGAESSVQYLFHHWFGDGSPYDVGLGSDVGVPPGYVVGGANQFYSGTNSPPSGQPTQKAYLDWAANGTQPSWELTEPAIYYQAAYVRLLTEVIASP